MNNIDWFCDLMGLKLYSYQKTMVQIVCDKQIKRMRGAIKSMTDYNRGYNQALEDINKPMPVVMEDWNPSERPRCQKDFCDFEPCDDGYYKRAMSLERCPFCGQKLDWSTK